MTIIHLKSHVECRDNVFDRQINDVHLKVTLEMKLAFI